MLTYLLEGWDCIKWHSLWIRYFVQAFPMLFCIKQVRFWIVKITKNSMNSSSSFCEPKELNVRNLLSGQHASGICWVHTQFSETIHFAIKPPLIGFKLYLNCFNVPTFLMIGRKIKKTIDRENIKGNFYFAFSSYFAAEQFWDNKISLLLCFW